MAVCLRGRPDARPGLWATPHAPGAGSGIADRVRFLGPLAGADLERVYAASDVLLLASRAETYGRVVTEALARGLPVVAMSVGGLPEAMGHSPEGTRPGLLCLRATRRRSQVPCGHG